MGIKDNIQKAYDEAQMGKFLTPTEKGIRVRILKFGEGEGENISRQVNQHFINDKPYNCLDSLGEECPLCAYAETLMQSQDKEEQKYGKKVSARKRFYFCAVNTDLALDKQEAQVLVLPKTGFDQIMSYFLDPEYEAVLLGPPGVGRDFVITKTGSGLGTEYEVKIRPMDSTINADIIPVDPIKGLQFLSKEELEGEISAF